MKFKLFPVVVTAAVTSVATIFVAARFQDKIPFLAQEQHQWELPVNYKYQNSDGIMRHAAVAPIDFENAAEASVSAVVHVKTQTKPRTVVQQDPFAQLFGDDFFGGRRQVLIPPQMGSGSGVVISADGYIVTNNHVVAGADKVTVTFNDRYTTEASVVGTDPSTDIAVLKVDEKNTPFMEFGNSDNVRLGQWVLAVGYPLTLDATVTAGIVSAKSRSIGINRTQSATAIESFIQTDAAVNPGNSGGALVNTDGQLIGINSAIASPTGSYAGYSYAIPANIVRKVVNDLMKFGTVQRAYLGIELLDTRSQTPQQLTALGLDKTEGVYVNGISPHSAAAGAGLRKGDIITGVNGVMIKTEPQLLEQIARYRPGDNISITYMRTGREYNATVQLKNIDGNTSIIKEQGSARLFGANFRSLSGEQRRAYRIDGGVEVTDIEDGAWARQTKMKKGFIITSVNDRTVTDVNDLQAVLGQSDNAKIGGFYPGYTGMYYYGLNNIKSLNKER